MSSENGNNGRRLYRPKEFAEMVGVSVRTLQRWDASGKLPAGRYPSGRRFYTDADYAAATGLEGGGSQDDPES